METVRELVLVLVAPGWTWRRERRPLAVALLAVGVVVPLLVGVWAVVSRRSWVALSLDRGFLAWLLVAFVAAVVARVVALVVWLLAGERSRERIGAFSVAAVIVVVPCMVGIVDVAQARADIAPVFTPTSDGAAVFDPDEVTTSTSSSVVTTTSTLPVTTTTVRLRTSGLQSDYSEPTTTSTTTTTLPPKPARPVSGVDPAAVADVHDILLLGGDAGPGRAGLRTDTMMLLSLHTPSGRASLISLPRDLEGLLFPPGSALEARYPYGFTEKANAVYPIVSSNRSLRAAYDTQGDIRPGVVATAEAIGYSLDVPIDDYVLIDMQGFIDLIDAVGGVTVQVTKELPMPGNVPGAKHEYPPTIGPGLIEMDGTTALGYVRSRYADSDFQRTRRQRDLLAALGQQVSFGDVIGRYGEVTGAVGGTLRTSLTPDELAHVLALIGGETAIVESVGLVPPLIDYRHPDFQRAAEVVGQVRLAIAMGTRSGF